MAADNDPLFLQVKEARASVLEPYAGKSLHPNHGQRVVVGQRLMQAASDVFLGWARGKNGRDFYIRQLRDMKLSAIIEDFDMGMMRQYARMCAHALARAHARSGDAAMMAGYMGSGQTFDDAVGEFAIEYGSPECRRLSGVHQGDQGRADRGVVRGLDCEEAHARLGLERRTCRSASAADRSAVGHQESVCLASQIS